MTNQFELSSVPNEVASAKGFNLDNYMKKDIEDVARATGETVDEVIERNRAEHARINSIEL